MIRFGVKGSLLFIAVSMAYGHDVITTAMTFDRDMARIIYVACASCHHEGGSAFSLMTYNDARPWAVAIKEEVLARRMPPWGAVKGFGDFRNDQALTPEQMERIVSWSDGGVPEGEAKDLPPPPKFDPPAPPPHGKDEITVSGEKTLNRAFSLDGLWPQNVPENASFMITAQLPDGQIEPLLWLKNYKKQFGHPFLYRKPLELPSGTIIHGVPAGSSVLLLPAVPQAPDSASPPATHTGGSQ